VNATGGPGAPGLTLNIPVPPGTTGDVLLYAFDKVVAPAAAAFGPSWVLISSGFDAHRDDPLANLALSAGDFADLAARAQALVAGPGRVVVVLEGGYHLGAISASAGAVAAALMGEGYRPERATSGGPGAHAVERARQVRSVLGQGG
jgi:acetoin utilization deacetylase AcuC-like enzyme